MTAGTVSRELALAFVVENSFGHDRARRVASAKEQNVVMVCHDCYSFAPARAGMQQPGWQQAACGFLARTKALKNFSST